jgi:hypothetical protein
MTGSLPVVRDRDGGFEGRHYSAATATESAQPFTSEYAINAREVLCAEICTINGRPVIRLSRWKLTPAGDKKRTGSAFEFGAHRTGVVAKLLSDIERELGGLPHAAT